MERSLRDSRASTDLTQVVVWGRGQIERGRTVLREIGLDKEQSLSPGDWAHVAPSTDHKVRR